MFWWLIFSFKRCTTKINTKNLFHIVFTSLSYVVNNLFCCFIDHWWIMKRIIVADHLPSELCTAFFTTVISSAKPSVRQRQKSVTTRVLHWQMETRILQVYAFVSVLYRLPVGAGYLTSTAAGHLGGQEGSASRHTTQTHSWIIFTSALNRQRFFEPI